MTARLGNPRPLPLRDSLAFDDKYFGLFVCGPVPVLRTTCNGNLCSRTSVGTLEANQASKSRLACVVS